MSANRLRTGFAVLACVAVLAASSRASQPQEIVFHYSLEPVSLPLKAGPVEINFGFTIEDDYCSGCKCCEELRITVVKENGLELHGDKSWTVSPTTDSSHGYSTVLSLTVFPNDTSYLRLEVDFETGGKASAVA
ncbi:MAG: hypothetical protein ACE5FH_11515 [Candidatus Zixiibacteriota bacterium]